MAGLLTTHARDGMLYSKAGLQANGALGLQRHPGFDRGITRSEIRIHTCPLVYETGFRCDDVLSSATRGLIEWRAQVWLTVSWGGDMRPLRR